MSLRELKLNYGSGAAGPPDDGSAAKVSRGRPMSDAEFEAADRLADLRARYLSVTNAAAAAARAAVADLEGQRGKTIAERSAARRKARRRQALARE